ncbi:MAG: Hpt domain-containing protein, partial [Roseiarcus sp.]
MAAIKQTFFQECEEQLAELETGLLAIDDGDHHPETVNAVFRAVHSIKGGAGAFSLDDLVHFAHAFETALDHLRACRLAPTPDLLKVMLRAADALADIVRAACDETRVDAQRIALLAGELSALDLAAASDEAGPAGKQADGEEITFSPVLMDQSLFEELEAPADRPREFVIRFKPKPALYAKANESALLLRELSSLGEMSIVCDAADLPLLPELDPEGAYLTWVINLKTRRDEAAIREVFEFVEWDCDLDIGAGAGQKDDIGIPALSDGTQTNVEAELAASAQPRVQPEAAASTDRTVADLA